MRNPRIVNLGRDNQVLASKKLPVQKETFMKETPVAKESASNPSKFLLKDSAENKLESKTPSLVHQNSNSPVITFPPINPPKRRVSVKIVRKISRSDEYYNTVRSEGKE